MASGVARTLWGAVGRGLVLAGLAAAACGGGAGARPEGAAAKAMPEARSGDEASATTRENVSAGEEAPPVRRDGTVYAETELMGTRVSMNVYVGPEASKGQAAAAGQAIRAAFDEIDRLERILSEWMPDSALSRLNRAAAAPMEQGVAVPRELVDVLLRARTISDATGGAFDVTFHGVGALWSFRPGATPPPEDEIRERVKLVDYRGVEVDPAARTVRLARPGMKIGLGAIAKGYAVDRASQVLRQRGFGDHIVEAGGDTYVSGTKGGRTWMVGVQDPNGQGPVGVLPVQDRAVVTSGDYQRFFEYRGKRYAHIIDPRTGWPVAREDAPRSVTVVASNATDADAFCTAVAVMGTREGLAFVERTPEIDAVILEMDGNVRVSGGLQGVYRPVPHRGATASAPPTAE